MVPSDVVIDASECPLLTVEEAARVLGAHEQRLTGYHTPTVMETRQGAAKEMHIPAAAVATGAGSVDHPDLLEHVEMMGQQVRLDPDQPAQLDRRSIRRRQLVDDSQAHRIP